MVPSLIITKSISNSSESTIKFVYEDNNILLTIVNNGVFIDSDISSLLNYDLGLQYAFDKNILPIYFNSKLVSIGKKYYSENLLKIK